jgi:hypothetical protein
MCFKIPLHKKSNQLPSKYSDDEDEEEEPNKVKGYFALQIIELEILLEQKSSMDLINKLVGLYTQAIEYFDDKEDPKCYDMEQRLHKMLSRPDVISTLKSPSQDLGLDSCTTYEQKKTDFEQAKKEMVQALETNLNPKVNHSVISTDLIDHHNDKTQKIASQITDSFNLQEKNLDSRVSERKKYMLEKSYNSISNTSFVGEYDMSGGYDRDTFMQKEIEEFLEENFTLLTTAVAEIHVKYETEITKLEGQGGVIALVVQEMRKNKNEEAQLVKKHYESIRRDRISEIKKKYIIKR